MPVYIFLKYRGFVHFLTHSAAHSLSLFPFFFKVAFIVRTTHIYIYIYFNLNHACGQICNQNDQSLFFILRSVDTDKSSHPPHDLAFDGTYTEDKLRPIKLRSSTIVPIIFYLGQPGRVDTLSPVTEEYLRSEGSLKCALSFPEYIQKILCGDLTRIKL